MNKMQDDGRGDKESEQHEVRISCRDHDEQPKYREHGFKIPQSRYDLDKLLFRLRQWFTSWRIQEEWVWQGYGNGCPSQIFSSQIHSYSHIQFSMAMISFHLKKKKKRIVLIWVMNSTPLFILLLFLCDDAWYVTFLLYGE